MKLTSTGAMIALVILVLAQAVAPYGAWYAAVALFAWGLVSFALDRVFAASARPSSPPAAPARPRCDHPDHHHDTEHDDA